MELFKILGSIGIITGGISTLAYFLYKTAVKNLFDRSLEKFKTNLNLDTQKHKLELDKQLFEYQNKLDRILTERAGVIKELFKYFVKADNAFHELLKPVRFGNGMTNEELAEDARIKGNEFIACFEENEILLKDDTCELLRGIRKIYLKAWGEHQATQRLKGTDHESWFVQVKKQNEFFEKELNTKYQN